MTRSSNYGTEIDSRPEQQPASVRVGVDVVLPSERQLAISADPEDRQARRNRSRVPPPSRTADRTLVSDDQDPSRIVECERARMIAAGVDRLDQRRLAGLLINRIDGDGVFAAGRDARIR